MVNLLKLANIIMQILDKQNREYPKLTDYELLSIVKEDIGDNTIPIFNIHDAVSYLELQDAVKAYRFMGNVPPAFNSVKILSRGRINLQLNRDWPLQKKDLNKNPVQEIHINKVDDVQIRSKTLEKKYDIFICYYHKTGTKFAQHLKKGIDDSPDYTAFLDDDNIPIEIRDDKDTWIKYRDEGLLNSERVLVIMTHLFHTREQVLYEIELALKHNISIVFFKYQGLTRDIKININDKIFDFSKIQTTSFTDEYDLLNRTFTFLENPKSLQEWTTRFNEKMQTLIQKEGWKARGYQGPKLEMFIGPTYERGTIITANKSNERKMSFAPYVINGRVQFSREYFDCDTLDEEFFRVHTSGHFHLIIQMIYDERDKSYYIDETFKQILEFLIYCFRVIKTIEEKEEMSISITLWNTNGVPIMINDSMLAKRKHYYSAEKTKIEITHTISPIEPWSDFKKLFDVVYEEMCIDAGWDISDTGYNHRKLCKILSQMGVVNTAYHGKSYGFVIPSINLSEFGCMKKT